MWRKKKKIVMGLKKVEQVHDMTSSTTLATDRLVIDAAAPPSTTHKT
jgi:hypothetical protein